MKKSSHPALRELQEAHRGLMQEYIACIERTVRLPFFVNGGRIFQPYDGETAFERSNRRMAFVFTPFTWRPFVLFLVEVHIKSKLNELAIAYKKYALELPDHARYQRYREWLKIAIAECGELSATLSTWKSAQSISTAALPILLGWVASAFGAERAMQFLQNAGVFILGVFSPDLLAWIYLVFVLLFIPVSILIFLINLAFIGKRAMLLPVFATRKIEVPTFNVYVTENKVFALMDHRKLPELAIDYVTYSFFIGLTLLFICSGINLMGLYSLWAFILVPLAVLAAMLIRFYNLRWD